MKKLTYHNWLNWRNKYLIDGHKFLGTWREKVANLIEWILF